MKKRDPNKLKYLDVLTKNYLIKEYIQNKKSISQIKNQLNLDPSTIKYYLLFHNIKLRSHKEQAAISSKGSNLKYPKKITKQYLINEYVKNNKSIKDIALELSVDRGTIKRYLKTYSINIRSTKQQIELNNPPKEFTLDSNIKDLIDGLIFGDASIPLRRNGTSPRNLTQGCKHEEYLSFIKTKFLEKGITSSPVRIRWVHDRRCKNKGYYEAFFQSHRYKTFESFRFRWYKNRKKIIPKDINLSPILLLHLYLCDGNFYREIRLCLNGFLKDDVLFFRQILNEKLKINCRLVNSTSGYELAIKKSETNIFLSYIGKCPTNCYKYKWKDNEPEHVRKNARIRARVIYLSNKIKNKIKNAKICNTIS